MQIIKNQKGQSMIEYVIIVALLGIGSIVMVRAVGENINVRMAKIVEGLGGKVDGDKRASAVSENMYRKKDLRDFMAGSIGRDDNSSASK